MSGRRNSGGGQSSLGYLFGNSDDQYEESSPPVCNSGGGQNSLGYLFGSDDQAQQGDRETRLSSPPVCLPPYGTDDMEQKSLEKALAPANKKDDHNPSTNNYICHQVDGENSKNILMKGRPSIKVTSIPGGDSSLGYLFGYK